MENPIQYVDDKIAQAAAAIELRVRIAVLEESAEVALSRLLTLNKDPKKLAEYQAALTALQG